MYTPAAEIPTHIAALALLAFGCVPYPCPRCGERYSVHVVYCGRREAYECQTCGADWSLPATPEQCQ
jgi:predicted RNA-binding Zn-ribbon protein involved in translation (DUF1610 family)